MTKQDLEVLIKCVEAAKISPSAFVPVGIAYNNANQMLESMGDGDLLVVFHADKGKKQVEGETPTESKESKPKSK